MRLSTFLKGLAALVAAAIVTASAVLLSTDLSAYKGEIARAVKEATGRELVIEGNLSPRLGLVPAIAVDGVRFANAPWGSRGDMARIARFRAEVELLPILAGDIRIRQIVLSGADILLETRADGAGNWMIAPGDRAASRPAAGPSDGAVMLPGIDRVVIEDSVLVWRDGRTGSSTTVRVDRFLASASAADAPLRLKLEGSYNAEAVAVEGTLGSLAGVISGAPLPIDLKLAGGEAEATVAGTVARPSAARGIELTVSVRGDDLAALSGLAGTALPAIGPYSLRATVADQGPVWQLKGLALRLGRSDLSGTVTVDPGARPVAITADLTSSLIRIADFGESAAPAGASGTGGASAASGGEARVFSAEPLPLDGLSAADLRLSLRAGQVEAGTTLLKGIVLDLALHRGELSVKPLQAEYAGGRLSAAMTLREARRTPILALDATLSGLDLAKAARQAGKPGAIEGKLDATARLSGAGGSVRAIMAGLDGSLALSMKGGRLDDQLLDVLSADVLNVLTPGSSGNRGLAINCLVGGYDVRGGKLVSRVTVFDTSRLLVAGEGGIDLGTERIDFLVVPKAKEASLAQLAVPLRVGGSLAAPAVYPDPAGVARGAIGLAAGIATSGITTVIGRLVSAIADASKEDVCAAALTASRAPQPSPPPESDQTPSAVDGVKKAIEGIGEGIGEGINILLGR